METDRVDHNKEMLEYAKRLVDEHWSFIEKALLTHGVNEKEIEVVRFWYKASGCHFFEHGVEWCLDKVKSSYYILSPSIENDKITNNGC